MKHQEAPFVLHFSIFINIKDPKPYTKRHKNNLFFKQIPKAKAHLQIKIL